MKIKKLNEGTQNKRIASTTEFDNGYIIHDDWKIMSDDEAEELARQKSIDNPDKVYYVQYDDIMNPSSDYKWKNGQKLIESKESEESELITQYLNNGEFDKLEKVHNGTNVIWKLKEPLTEATHCIYFTQDGIEQIEFEGTEDECNKYISDIQAEQDDEFGDEAPERFIKRLDEASEGFQKEFYNDYVILKNRAGDGWDIYSYDGTPEKVTKAYLEDEGFATLQAAKDEIDKWNDEAKLDESTQPLYIIKDNKGNQLSAPNPDDGELWDRVASMEARGRRGLSVVAYVDKTNTSKGPYIELSEPQAYIDELDFAGAVEIKGNKVYADEETLRQLAGAIAAEYGWSVNINEDTQHLSNGLQEGRPTKAHTRKLDYIHKYVTDIQNKIVSYFKEIGNTSSPPYGQLADVNEYSMDSVKYVVKANMNPYFKLIFDKGFGERTGSIENNYVSEAKESLRRDTEDIISKLGIKDSVEIDIGVFYNTYTRNSGDYRYPTLTIEFPNLIAEAENDSEFVNELLNKEGVNPTMNEAIKFGDPNAMGRGACTPLANDYTKTIQDCIAALDDERTANLASIQLTRYYSELLDKKNEVENFNTYWTERYPAMIKFIDDQVALIPRNRLNFKDANENTMNEASYGGAFDIADDQYFTREDIENAAEEVMGHITETFTEPYHLGGTWFENGQWIVNVQGEQFDEYEISLPVDMRKIKEPWHLKRAYASEMAAKLIAQIKEYNGMNEAITSSSIEFDDDTDDLSYYYDDELFKNNLENSPYTEIASKQVPDSDGFMTDYTMYRNINTGEYVFVFGDKDVYSPDNGNSDWSCDTEAEAQEWFNNYNGFEEDTEHVVDENFNESLEDDLNNRYVVGNAHTNKSVLSNIEELSKSEFVKDIEPVTKYNIQIFEMISTNDELFYLIPVTMSQFDVYNSNEKLIAKSEFTRNIIDEIVTINGNVEFIYELAGGEYAGTYDEVESLPCFSGKYTSDQSDIRDKGGFTSKKELDNKPILNGYVGPMMNGWKNHKMVLRYETQEVYDALSH